MTEFLAVAAAHFLALLSPGPDFFIIISAALRNGAKRATITCLGIALANGVYILLAVAGFTILRHNGWVLWFMKIAGGAFLCYMGFMLLRSAKRELFEDNAEKTQDSGLRLFMAGFTSAILNPKNPIFYLSLYSLFISTTTPVFTQSMYGVWMFAAVLLWDIFVAFSVGNRRVRSWLNSYTFRLEQFAGAVIICLGVLLGFQ